MAGRRQAQGSTIYQLQVTLRDSKPPIWRRLQLSADTRLERLHIILQIAMGWTDSHLHQFIINNEYYSQPEFDLGDFGHKVHSEKRVKLNQLGFEPKSKFFYEYDFGDGWEHEILLEKILEREEGVHYPRCVAGKRACPPEDCGGVWGYERLLEVISDPSDEEHESMMEWLGGSFDPEYFSIEKVNDELKSIR